MFNLKTLITAKNKKIFGLRQKINPKSFADGSHTPKGPYAASVKSVQTSDKYLKYGYLSENDRIVNGFRDGGRNASFTKFGDTLYADREVITVDLEKDVYLQNLLKYVKKKCSLFFRKIKNAISVQTYQRYQRRQQSSI